MTLTTFTPTTFTPIEGLIGGALIGLASVIWLGLYGRVSGISGILHGAVFQRERGERGWRWFYLAGIVAGAAIYQLLGPNRLPGTHFTVNLQVGWWLMLVAGLVVGIGTRIGNGCTSGHGVCGISRLSPRSFVATVTFILTGILATWVTRHLFGI